MERPRAGQAPRSRIGRGEQGARGAGAVVAAGEDRRVRRGARVVVVGAFVTSNPVSKARTHCPSSAPHSLFCTLSVVLAVSRVSLSRYRPLMPITLVDHRVLAPGSRPDGSPYAAPAAVRERFARQVPEGIPLLFDAGGHFDRLLYRFVRELSEGGESDRRPQRSERSWLATARDIDQWLDFLHEQRNGVSWVDASLADTRAYKRYRLSSGAVEEAAECQELESASELGGQAVPVGGRGEGRRSGTIPVHDPHCPHRGRGPRRSSATPLWTRTSPTGDVKFLSLDDYVFWRDVGLRGRLPDGSEDPRWRGGRFAARNLAFAELLVTTGMRLEEASVQLVAELPAPQPGEKSAKYRVASNSAKYQRGRTFACRTGCWAWSRTTWRWNAPTS